MLGKRKLGKILSNHHISMSVVNLIQMGHRLVEKDLCRLVPIAVITENSSYKGTRFQTGDHSPHADWSVSGAHMEQDQSPRPHRVRHTSRHGRSRVTKLHTLLP